MHHFNAGVEGFNFFKARSLSLFKWKKIYRNIIYVFRWTMRRNRKLITNRYYVWTCELRPKPRAFREIPLARNKQ
jgi:hypothetical protein